MADTFSKAIIGGLALGSAALVSGCATPKPQFNLSSCQTTVGGKHKSFDFSCLEVNKAMALVNNAIEADRIDPLPAGEITRASRMIHLAAGGVVKMELLDSARGQQIASEVRDFMGRKAEYLLKDYDSAVHNWEVLLDKGEGCFRGRTSSGDYKLACEKQDGASQSTTVSFDF